MKQLSKWVLRSALFMGLLLTVLYFTGQVKVGLEELLQIYLSTVAAFAVSFYLIESKLFPFRQKQIAKKLVRIFGAEFYSDSQARYSVGDVEILIDVNFILSFSSFAPNGELISFHVARDQIDLINLSWPLSKTEDELGGIASYRIYQTNGMGLKLARRRIEKRVFQANKERIS